jgi:hypothetical protein
MGAGGLLSARVWEEEAEERRMRQREEDVSLRWRRARVTAEGARARGPHWAVQDAPAARTCGSRVLCSSSTAMAPGAGSKP